MATIMFCFLLFFLQILTNLALNHFKKCLHSDGNCLKWFNTYAKLLCGTGKTAKPEYTKITENCS